MRWGWRSAGVGLLPGVHGVQIPASPPPRGSASIVLDMSSLFVKLQLRVAIRPNRKHCVWIYTKDPVMGLLRSFVFYLEIFCLKRHNLDCRSDTSGTIYFCRIV